MGSRPPSVWVLDRSVCPSTLSTTYGSWAVGGQYKENKLVYRIHTPELLNWMGLHEKGTIAAYYEHGRRLVAREWLGLKNAGAVAQIQAAA